MRIRHISDADIAPTVPRVIALGLFDGVHRGHAALLSRTVALAEQRGAVPAAFTFLDHSFKTGEALLTFGERMDLFAALGIEEVFTARFAEVKELSPADFIHTLLVKRLGAVGAVCGFDFRFGKDAEGDAALLCRLLPDTVCLPPVIEDGTPISATRVREAVKAGELALAERLLGRPYSVFGKVVHGKALGRTAGIPTANLHAYSLLPAPGVYLTVAEIRDTRFPALTDVGVRPTVETDGVLRAETHIPDLTWDIYDEEILITFTERLRPEMRFESQDALWRQVERDLAAWREAVAEGRLPAVHRVCPKTKFREEF